MSKLTTKVLLTVTFCLSLSACEKPPVEAGPFVRPVKIHTVGSLDAETTREYPGTIRAFQTAEMGFEVAGRITEFWVREGDAVVQGEVLAELDPRDYEAQLKASEADLRKAQADLDRSLNIRRQDPGAISTETIDTHRRALDVAKAKLEVAKKAAEDTQLRAPFSGLMARKLVEDFANVQAKEPVLVLQDMSILEIEVNVPERDVAQGRRVQSEEAHTEQVRPQVIVSAIPDRSFPARVKEFAQRADPVTRTFPVKLNFNNPEDVTILPGMTARVRAIVDPERAWSVPVAAAQADENGQSYVWKVDPTGMTVTRVAVETGDLFGDRIQLRSGVANGDMIAVSGVTQLREGMKVRKLEQQ